MANSGARFARLSQLKTTGGSPVVCPNGHSYPMPGVGNTLRVPLVDATVLVNNGWGYQYLTGATSERPAPTDIDWPEVSMRDRGAPRFFDETLSALLFYDESSATSWRNAITFAAA